MAKYLLTCSCGNMLPVDVGQAGGQLVCSCGRTIDVPTLRNLRHLPPVTTAEPKPAATWSVRKGVITVFLIPAGLLAAVALWHRLTEPKLPEFQPQAHAESVEKHFDQVTPVDAWKSWIVHYRPLAERGFTPLERSDAPQIRDAIAQSRFMQGTLLSVAGVCLAVAAIAALWPAGKKRGRHGEGETRRKA